MGAKLSLGAVQFGMPYGIANREGKVPTDVVKNILGRARHGGISLIDTAADYGDSEVTIGACGLEDWKIVTKLPAHLPASGSLVEWVDHQVTESLRRLRAGSLYGLLLHRPEQLQTTQGQELWRAMENQRERGRVNRIGYSIYDPIELGYLYTRFKPDLVQSPYNVFDRRLMTSGWLPRLVNDGVEVHTRSAYLQGLLLMAPDQRPVWTREFSEEFTNFDNWIGCFGGNRLAAALGYCLATPGIDHVLVGVQSVSQLDAALAVAPILSLPDWRGAVAPALINPAHWAKL